MTDAPTRELEVRELARWQGRLLPFLIIAISLMAVFFFVSSLLQLGRLSEAVAYRPDTRVAASLEAFERQSPKAVDVEYARWKTLVLLEEGAVRQRYAQVNATLMLRAWTRHLGFLTGMILALVGAIFILAKLSESETKLSMQGVGGAGGALATSSPGIVLAVLGSVLMVVTLTIDFEFTTTDVPVYLGRASSSADAMPPPAALDDEQAIKTEEQALFGPEEKTDERSTREP